MELAFTKMHGLGNDFVVIDALRQRVMLSPEQIRRLADRHHGVGCDQVLMVEAPRNGRAEFRYRIFNADGGEVEQCGNGARCFARYVHEAGMTESRSIPVETATGIILLRLEADGQVSVDMGVPQFEPARIPFQADARQASYELQVEGECYRIGAVSMGNPHAVLPVEDAAAAPVAHLGPRIEQHPRFPNRVNVGFSQIQNRGSIRLRVWERGVGETCACGTGACAAVAVARIQGLVDDQVLVSLRGGELRIRWPGEGETLIMTGPAERVFDGRISL